ncbi:MAG: hypothetical protein WED11_02570, partial [Natronospirillum sp.]
MGEAKRRKETGQPSPAKNSNRKPLALGVSVLVILLVIIGVFFLTAAPDKTSDELPVAAPDADAFP